MQPAATASIPVVMAGSDPVALGLAASLARPGGNVTGLSFANVLHAGKNLDLLKQAVPATRRVAALWYAPNASGAALLREIQDAAPRLGLELRPVGVQGPDGFEAAFRAAAGEHADALFVINAGMNSQPVQILEFVAGVLNISPSQSVPVIRTHDGQTALELMRWGFQPGWVKG